MSLKQIIITFILLIIISNAAKSQIEIKSLEFKAIQTIPYKYKFENTIIEEISGIEFTGYENEYYLLPQSKDESHVFIATIKYDNNSFKVNITKKIKLNKLNLDAESIRINPVTKSLFIAEERKTSSCIYEVDNLFNLKEYIKNINHYHNRGIEGLCFVPNSSDFFVSIERNFDDNFTQIIKYGHDGKIIKTFEYKLHDLDEDSYSDNGITELLCINDTTLLILERAYLRKLNRNSIRLYKGFLPTDNSNQITEVQLLSNFDQVPHIDNIEGMAFTADKKGIIFVSDNNKNQNQQTQIIYMEIK